jgi:hypothetical protein
MIDDLNEIERGQLCQSTIESLYEATGGMKHFPGLLKKIIRNKAWEKRITRGKVVELSNLRELITEKPLRGWGEDIRVVENVIKDDAECLAMFREAMKEQAGRPSKESANNVSTIQDEGRNTEHGNSRAYSITRVQKECDEETVKQVMTGKLSPNAALVKAGIRENRQVYIPRDPAKAVEKLRESLGLEFWRALVEIENANSRK